MPLDSTGFIPTNNGETQMSSDGILEAEFGFYLQDVASDDLQDELEQTYVNGELNETENYYTNDSAIFDEESFKPQKLQEFEYNGNRYVRVEVFLEDANETYSLSNNKTYENGDSVWVKVQPVKWLVDEDAGIMITEKILFAGIQFNEEKNKYESDFEKSFLKEYLDKFFAKELLQGKEIEGITENHEIEQSTNQAKKVIKKENQYEFDFSKVNEEDILRGAIEANIPIFLHGKPGCGKSDRVKQLDPDFIELNLAHLDPELLDGLAGEKEGKSVHIKPPWLEELEEKCENEPDKIHILFLDELTNASGVMQSKAYGIVLDKKVAGRWKLPENVRVVGAGNELDDSLVANEMAEPLFGRYAHVYIETSPENWLKWAVTPENTYEKLEYKKDDKPKQKIHPAVYAYISYKGDQVLRTEYNRENPQPYADPRRWKMASDMLYATNNPNMLKAVIGEPLTRDFVFFCKIPVISIQDVLEGNYTQEDIDKMDLGRKHATVSGLVGVDNENMPIIREFVKKLGAEMCRKFEVQWAHGDEERLEQLQELMMEEQEKTIESHDGKEAQAYDELAVESFKEISEKYKRHLDEKRMRIKPKKFKIFEEFNQK